jgi:hypothetical protein
MASVIFAPFLRLCAVISGTNRVRVLVYHRICGANRGDVQDEWTVMTERFEEQMRFLRKDKYVILTVDELLTYMEMGKQFPKKAVCITFDDGYQNNYDHAFPILAELGISATFYLTTDYIGSTRPLDWKKKLDGDCSLNGRNLFPLTWEQVREMTNYGMDFASHSHTHANFNLLDSDSIKREVTESQVIMARYLSHYGRSIACPFRVKASQITKVQLCLKDTGCSGAFLGTWGSVGPDTNRFNMPRMSVYRKDSLYVFRQKIEGLYDWLSPIYSIWKHF